MCSLCVQVLPPLRDVKNRPEVGSTLRNKLVRLMTHIDTDVKACAAEFLFILCKESGERNIVYPLSGTSSLSYQASVFLCKNGFKRKSSNSTTAPSTSTPLRLHRVRHFVIQLLSLNISNTKASVMFHWYDLFSYLLTKAMFLTVTAQIVVMWLCSWLCRRLAEVNL